MDANLGRGAAGVLFSAAGRKLERRENRDFQEKICGMPRLPKSCSARRRTVHVGPRVLPGSHANLVSVTSVLISLMEMWP
jgi:hypothetical protein